MPKEEFNAAEVIAGFPLPSIRHALSSIGFMDNRDDIKTIADALECPTKQAERVLHALEQRGFVTKATKMRQWDMTPLGKRLLYQWKPPRRLTPAIECASEPSRGNEVFESVPCSVMHFDSQGDTFEEADVEVGVFVEYEDHRLIEISVEQPDDYDHRGSGSTTECAVRLGVADAKKFAKALEISIAAAEEEIAHRAKARPRKRKHVEPEPKSKIAATRGPVASSREADRPAKAKEGSASSLASGSAAPKKTGASTKARDDERRKRKEQAALAATLKELRAKR